MALSSKIEGNNAGFVLTCEVGRLFFSVVHSWVLEAEEMLSIFSSKSLRESVFSLNIKLFSSTKRNLNVCFPRYSLSSLTAVHNLLYFILFFSSPAAKSFSAALWDNNLHQQRTWIQVNLVCILLSLSMLNFSTFPEWTLCILSIGYN